MSSGRMNSSKHEILSQGASGNRRAAPGASQRRAWWCFWAAFALAGLALESLSGAGLSADPELRVAYLDPGTGSFVIQALVAMLAGIAVAAKVYWQRIKGFLGFAVSSDDDDAPESRDER